MQRRMARGLAVAGVGVVGMFVLVTSGEAQVPPFPSIPTFTTPTFTTPTFTVPTTTPPPTMPPPTTTPPPTMPPSTTTPPPTMPPSTSVPRPSIPPNIDSLIQTVIDELEQFGDDFADLIDELQALQAKF